MVLIHHIPFTLILGTAGILHKKEDFLLDARTILKSKTLELEKLKLTTPYGISNPVQTIDINSKSPFHDETEWIPYPLYFSDTEKQSISTRIQIVRQAVVKEMIMSGNKKYKHAYKTPYFVHEYGSNSGRRRSSRGLSKHAKRPVGRSTSLPLDKEQLHTSEISDGTARINLEGKDTANYSVLRDPRLARRRTGDFSVSLATVSDESKDLHSNLSMMKASGLEKIDEGSRTFATDKSYADVNNRRLSLESALPSSHRNGNFTYRNTTHSTEYPASVDFPGFEKQRSKEYEIALKPAGSFHDPLRNSSRSALQDPRMGGSTKEYLLRHQNNAVDLVQSGRIPSYTSVATNINDGKHSASAGRHDLCGHSSSTGKHSEAIEIQNPDLLHVSFASASRDGYGTQLTRREEVGKTNVNYTATIGNTQEVRKEGAPLDSYALSEKRFLNEAVKSKKDCEGQFSEVSSYESRFSMQGSLPSENSTSSINLPAVLAKLVAPSSYGRKSTAFQPPGKERLSSSGDSVCISSVTTVANSPANFDAKSTVTFHTASTVKNTPLNSIPSCTGSSVFVTTKLASLDAQSVVKVRTTSAIKNTPLSSIPSCTGSSALVKAKSANFDAKSSVEVKTTSAIKNTPLSSIPSCTGSSAFLIAKSANFDAKSTVEVRTTSAIKNTPLSSIPSCSGNSASVAAKLAYSDAKSAVTTQTASTVEITSVIMNAPLNNLPSSTGNSTFVTAMLANLDTQSAVTVQTATTLKSAPLNNAPSFIASNAQAFKTISAIPEESAQSDNGQNQCALSSAEKVEPKSDSNSLSVSAKEATHSVSTSSEKDSRAKLNAARNSLTNSSAKQASSVSDIANSELHSQKAEQIDTLPIQTQPPTNMVFPPSSTKATLSSQTLESETPRTAITTDNVSTLIPEKTSAPKSSSHSSAQVAVSSAPIKSSVSEKPVVHTQTTVEKSESQKSSAVWQRAKAKQQHAANLIDSAAFSILAQQQALMQQRRAYHQFVQSRWNIINPHLQQQSVLRTILPQLNVQQNVAFQRFPAKPLIPVSIQRFVGNLPGALCHGNAQVPLSPFPPSSSSCKKHEYNRGGEQNIGLFNPVSEASEAMELRSQSNNDDRTINKEMIAFDDIGANASANINVLQSAGTRNDPVSSDSLISKVVNGKCSLPQRMPSKEHLESELQTEELAHRQVVGEGGGTVSEISFDHRDFGACIERDTGSQRDISDPFLYNHRSQTQADERYASTCEPNTHMTSDGTYNTSSYDASYQALAKAANDVEQIKKVIEGLEEAPRIHSLRPHPFATKARRSARNVATEIDCRRSNSSSERRDGFNLSLSWSEEEVEELEAISASSNKARNSFLHQSDYSLMGSKMADEGRNSRRLEDANIDNIDASPNRQLLWSSSPNIDTQSLEDANIDNIDASPNRQLLWSSSPNIDTQSAVEDSRVDVYSGLHDLERDDANEYEDISKEREIDLHRRYGIALNNEMAGGAMENILGSRGSNELNQTTVSDLYEEKDRSLVEPGDSDSSIDYERLSCIWQRKKATKEYDRLDRYSVLQRSRGSEKSNHSSEHGIHLERNIEHLAYDDAEEALDSRKESRRVVISPSPMIESDPIWEELDNKYEEYCIRNEFLSNSRLSQIKGNYHKDLASSEPRANESLNSYVNESETEFQTSKRGTGKRPAMFVEGTSNEYRRIEDNDGYSMPFKHLALVSDLQKTRDDDSVKPSRIKKQIRRVKVMSEENTMSVLRETSEEDWVTIFRNEKEEGEISTQEDENNEEAHESNVISKNLDLRTVLNKMRGRKSAKAGSSHADVYSSDNAQNHRDIEPKRVRRKVSVVGKKSKQRVVTKVQKETLDQETSSKKRVETSKRKHHESDSSDAKLKLVKHEPQRKRLYSRSDRSRKRRKSCEKREDRRRSSSSSSSSCSEDTQRRDESLRTRVRKRQRYAKSKNVLEKKPEPHRGKANPLQHNVIKVVRSTQRLVPSVNCSARADRTEDVGSKSAEKHEQISDGNKNIVDKERKRGPQVESPANWYDAEEFTKFDVSNDGVDHVSSIPYRKNVIDDNLKEPTRVSSAQHHIPSDMVAQGGNEVMVSKMYDEVYSNVSPVSDAEDIGISGGQNETYYDYEVGPLSTTRQLSSGLSGCGLRDLVDVPEAVIISIDELDKHVVEEDKHINDEELKGAEAVRPEPEILLGSTCDRHLTKERKQLGKEELKRAEAVRAEPEKLLVKTFDRHFTEERKQLGKEELKGAEAVRPEPEKLTKKALEKRVVQEYARLESEELEEAGGDRAKPEKLTEKALEKRVVQEYARRGSEELEEAGGDRAKPEKLTEKALEKRVVQEYARLESEELEEAGGDRAKPEKLTEKALEKRVVKEFARRGSEELEEAKGDRAKPEKLTEKALNKHVVEAYARLGSEELEQAKGDQAKPENFNEKAHDKRVVEECRQLYNEEVEETYAARVEAEKLAENAHGKSVVDEYKQLDNVELEEAKAGHAEPKQMAENVLDDADSALINTQYARVSPDDDRTDREKGMYWMTFLLSPSTRIVVSCVQQYQLQCLPEALGAPIQC